MNKLITGALSRPTAVVVAWLGLLAFGLLAAWRIPVDILPKLDAPVVYIAQRYGGRLPPSLEGFMAARYQSQLLHVPGVKSVAVRQVQDLTLLTCSFSEQANLARAAAEAANAVRRLQAYLPPGSPRPVVVRFDASLLPVGQLVFSSVSRPLNELQDLAATRIGPLLARIPGASVPPFGGTERTVVIRADPAKMQRYGITPDQLVQALVQDKQPVPVGVPRAYPAPTDSAVAQVADFGTLVLRLAPGGPVLVRDVATVAAADQTVGSALINGKRAAYIPVTMAGDASAVAVVKALKAKLPEMQSRLPPDVRLSYEFDQSGYVSNAVSALVAEGLLETSLLGLAVLLLLRDWRSALLVALTVPIASLASVLLLHLAGSTLNSLTLSGLFLASGFLIDQAIVTMENIHQHLERGKPRARAILDGCREVASPQLLVLLCLLAGFAPLLLLTGFPRAMFLPLALATAFALLAAFLLALTLVPVLANWWLITPGSAPLVAKELPAAAAHLPREQNQAQLPHKQWRSSGFNGVRRGYQAVLRRLMPHRGWVIGGYLLLTCGLAGLLVGRIGQDLLPHRNGHQFQVRISSPVGAPPEASVRQVLASIDQLVGHQNVEISAAFVGLTPGSYGTGSLYEFNDDPREATLQVALNEDLKLNMDDFKDRLRAAVHQVSPAEQLSFEPLELAEKIMSQGARTPLEVQVGGRDLGQSRAFAAKLVAKLKAVPCLRDLRTRQPLSYPALRITIDRQRAAHFGLTAEAAEKALVAAVSPRRFNVKSLWLGKKSGYTCQMQLSAYGPDSLVGLAARPLRRGLPRPTVADVATVTRETIASEYDRSGPRRLVTVSANVAGSDLGSATRQVQQLLGSLGPPPAGTTVELHGQAHLLTEVRRSLPAGLGLAAVVIFLVLSAWFQSFRISLAVLASIPAVLAGALGLLWLTGSTLNLQSGLGIGLAVSVSLANAILLITSGKNLLLQGHDATWAASRAGGRRLRPLLLTWGILLVSMLPVAAGLGETGEQVAPLGRAAIGGLLFSACATLFVLPLVFSALLKKPPANAIALLPDDDAKRSAKPPLVPQPALGVPMESSCIVAGSSLRPTS